MFYMKTICTILQQTVIFVCMFCIYINFTNAQNISALDSFFNLLKNDNKVMGTIAISKNGKMLYTKSIGYSLYNNDKKIQASGKTKYRIGSISKTFTSAIIFQLIEEKILSLECTIDKFFPAFPNASRITICDLLNHKSGIRNITRIKNQQLPRTQMEMIEIIAGGKQLEPGKKTAYSNANYLLLGYIIEKILNKPFSEILQERIVSKISLPDTYYTKDPVLKNEESYSYNFLNDWLQVPNTDPSITGASGGILSTPQDLTRFIEALFCGRIINLKSLSKITTINENYGMGIIEFNFHGKKAFGQIGGIDHFESVVAYFPSDSLAVAFCLNGFTEPLKNTIVKAMDIFFDYSYDKMDARIVKKDQPDPGKYPGSYVCNNFSAKIIIFKNKSGLLAQPIGYSSYRLQALGDNMFGADAQKAIITFNRGKNKFTLNMGDKRYYFSKEN